MGNHTSIPTSSKHTMKIFLLFVGLMAKEAFCQKRITVDTRAPSTYQNCNCQCDSTTWTDGSTIKGNCLTSDNNGQLRYYSYNACTTPPRNQCNNNNNFGNQNWGDGDYQSNGGSSSSSYRPGGSNSYRPGGSNSYRPGGSGLNLGSIL